LGGGTSDQGVIMEERGVGFLRIGAYCTRGGVDEEGWKRVPRNLGGELHRKDKWNS